MCAERGGVGWWGVGGEGSGGPIVVLKAHFTWTSIWSKEDEHKVHFYRFCLDRDTDG